MKIIAIMFVVVCAVIVYVHFVPNAPFYIDLCVGVIIGFIVAALGKGLSERE